MPEDLTGINRDATGTIVNPPPPSESSTPSTTPETPSSPTTPNDQTSLLNRGPAEPPKPAEGAPDKYDDYKVPEGFTLDGEVKGEADALFKSLGLNQAGAQSLIDLYTKHTQEAFNAPYEAYNQMRADWKKSAEEHPDLRGKLEAGKEINVRIGRFLDGLPDQALARDFRNLMDLTGAGDHPAFIRVLDYAAKMVAEGTPVEGRGPSPLGQTPSGTVERPSAARALYPNNPSTSR